MEPAGAVVSLAARGASSTCIGSRSGTRSNSALTAKGITHIVQVDLVGADDGAKSDESSQPSTHHVASETTSARTRAAIRRRIARHYHSQHFRAGRSKILSGSEKLGERAWSARYMRHIHYRNARASSFPHGGRGRNTREQTAPTPTIRQ